MSSFSDRLRAHVRGRLQDYLARRRQRRHVTFVSAGRASVEASTARFGPGGLSDRALRAKRLGIPLHPDDERR